ncbi:MAG TPA: uroporphyrinogen-III synthase [Gammaproteobacteria bacterium]|jgi:uroporphyrinogen-III synthase
MPPRLQGQVILNTRPAHQQAELTALLERDGARVLSFPVIEIVASGTPLAQPVDHDILLFVSRNAVDHGLDLLDATRLPPGVQLGVIGAATRAALLERVGDVGERLIESQPFNSEALLEADALQRVAGKRILILRGQAGRNLLGDQLSARGAQVDYLEVYRRELPRHDPAAFERLTAERFPTLVVLTSNEGMHNLFELVETAAAARLRAIPWLLISERMRESALKLGHNGPIVIAHGASDDGIWQTIREWAKQR